MSDSIRDRPFSSINQHSFPTFTLRLCREERDSVDELSTVDKPPRRSAESTVCRSANVPCTDRENIVLPTRAAQCRQGPRPDDGLSMTELAALHVSVHLLKRKSHVSRFRVRDHVSSHLGAIVETSMRTFSETVLQLRFGFGKRARKPAAERNKFTKRL